MNEVYDNNMKLIPLLKFLDKYKKVLIFLGVLIVSLTLYFLVTAAINKKNHEEAAIVYDDWLEKFSSEETSTEELNEIISTLVNEYESTGYTQVALLSKANLDANNNKFDEALSGFEKLIEITNGYNGNKIFNKIGRVSAARIKLANGDFDEALEFIQKYSSSDTNAYIHELTGDILLKKDQLKLAKSQYQTAFEKYSDQTSRSIISMKLANLEASIE